MEPKVSVIVPIYNVEQYLDRCIQSLIHQTLKDIEIILVDDGSPDNCPAMCDHYAEQDSRIKVVHKINGGLGFARNSGIDAATGEYIAFVDSDDYIALDFYEKLYNNAKENESDICLGAITYIKDDRHYDGRHIFAGKVFDKTQILCKLLPSTLGSDENGMGYSSMSTCIGIFKRSLINDNNIRFVSEREYISEDAIFDIAIYQAAQRVSFIDSGGYYYCYNGASLSQSYKPDRFEQFKKLCQYEMDILKESPVAEICKIRIYSTFLGNLRAMLKQEAVHGVQTKSLKFIKNRMKTIVNDSFLQKVLKEYNYSNLPKKQKISCICLKNKWWRLTFVLSYLQSRKS